jgi:hypothetical protein
MFKKVSLVVVALLAIAPFASAAMIGNVLEINVNGTPVSSIAPGTYTLSLTNNAEIASGSNEGYFLLVTDVANLIDASAATVLNEDLFIMDDAAGLGQAVPPGTNGPIGGVFDFNAAYPIGTILFGAISLTASVPGSVQVWAVDDDGVTIGQMMDSVTITPEPATLALLGLGGLLLRKRK